MGKFGIIFFGKTIAQLEAFKATLKDPKEIAEVDEAIRVLQEKGE